MIIFYCPLGQKPNGGHKVIYKTVENLNISSVDSYIFHEICNYKLNWFKYSKNVKFTNKIPLSAHTIIPEVSLLTINQKIYKTNYSILVQNGYFIFYNCETKESYSRLKKIYHDAKHIYCVSPDTANCVLNQFPSLNKKIINFIPDVDKSIFKINKNDYYSKKNIITIMPRKNQILAKNIIKHMINLLPNNWKIQVIDNLNEIQVAKIFKISKIFINVPGPEGFPLPPLEAALCGNIVIGSTGNGAKIYWKIFKYQATELGDILTICENLLIAIKKNIFNDSTSGRVKISKFLNSKLKLHQVIQSNYYKDTHLFNNPSDNKEIVYSAKNSMFYKYNKIKNLILKKMGK